MNGFSVLTISDRADMSVRFLGWGFWDEGHSEFLNVGNVAQTTMQAWGVSGIRCMSWRFSW